MVDDLNGLIQRNSCGVRVEDTNTNIFSLGWVGRYTRLSEGRNNVIQFRHLISSFEDIGMTLCKGLKCPS